MHDLTLAAQYADRMVLLDGGARRRGRRRRRGADGGVIARHYDAAIRVVTVDGGSPSSRASGRRVWSRAAERALRPGRLELCGQEPFVTALARAFRRRGVRVAPFKAQNMSNNARVVDGGEIGVAQYLQALAAGSSPTCA